MYKSLCVIFVLFLCACAGSPAKVKPLTDADHSFNQSEKEQWLLGVAERSHQEFLEKGLIYRDKSTNAYLQNILDQLHPELPPGAPKLTAYVFKDASINAFAMPNGNIYIHAGLIAKLDSRSKLALVMGHEASHVVLRHSYRRQMELNNTLVSAHIADLLLFGTGLAYLPAVLNITSYSQEMEKEADLAALDLLAQHDFDLQDSVGTFDELNELKHEKETASIWSSHPARQQRKTYSLAYLKTLGEDTEKALPPDPEYAAFRARFAELTVRLRLLANQYELAADAALLELKQQGNHATWHYYLGESYRKRAENPDAAAREHAWLYDARYDEALQKTFVDQVDANREKASEYYQKALADDADYMQAYRGIGLLAYRESQFDAAREALNRYLMSPDITDRRYIQSILEKMPENNNE